EDDYACCSICLINILANQPVDDQGSLFKPFIQNIIQKQHSREPYLYEAMQNTQLHTLHHSILTWPSILNSLDEEEQENLSDEEDQ
ncbi:hypothetical protein BGZ70_006616, partial [Mortierella alpina]